MQSRSPGIFVTGTDTGVGKTFVSCALVAALRASGIDLGVMKPVETGVPASGPEDALALQRAAGVADPLELVCPLRFDLPAAPEAAARYEGKSASLAPILDAYSVLAARHQAMWVEGAGGLLVPFDSETTMADLVRALELPLLIVARASLGTINHTRLTLESCEQQGLDVLGVVISHATGPLSDADEHNLSVLRSWLGSRLIGEARPRSSGHEADLDGLDPALERISAELEGA